MPVGTKFRLKNLENPEDPENRKIYVVDDYGSGLVGQEGTPSAEKNYRVDVYRPGGNMNLSKPMDVEIIEM